MSISFTKLFASITESTIWLEPMPTRIVWITMLAMADRNGLVFGSVPGLAHRARVSVDECRAALRTLLEPDPDSRTKDNEGRRIDEIDGGWVLLNHAKYRAIQDAERIRNSKRESARKRRSAPTSTVDECRQNMSTDVYVDIGRKSPSASASASDSDLRSDPDPDLLDQVGSAREAEPGSHPTPEDTDSRAPAAPSRAPMPLGAAEARRVTKASQGGVSRTHSLPSEEPSRDYLEAAVMAGVSADQARSTWAHYWGAGLPDRGVERLTPWLVKRAKERSNQLAKASRGRGSRPHSQPDAGIDPWQKANIL